MPRSLDLDDVLEAFALEPRQGDDVLMEYVRRYPEHASEIVEYARQLALAEEADAEDVEADDAWLEESWQRFVSAANAESSVTDPFEALTPTRWAEVRRATGLPSSVATAFRDRAVDMTTVPDWVVDRFASLLNVANDNFRAFQDQPRRLAGGLQYRADTTPTISLEKVSFEALLEQALLSPEERARLMRGPA
ncbi:MAG: hypothetical protein KJ916_14475 [Alphaproteobacteria bacterium]|nr:hypothetical protein [Alphaproteobacteria bacterium]MBU2349925.1 hypothetical protein [Alphaproteobacteria bacterium]MBU2381574.1 hypothetical protein [Alphaproteobacteria bacterium]